VHYDSIFGTVLNRFVVQAAMGLPLTVYGSGGQTRAFLNIRDTLQCVYLAAMTPAAPGEFRVMNQFTEQFSVTDLAQLVTEAGNSMRLSVRVENLENPRIEKETHYYHPVLDGFRKLGLEPHLLTKKVVLGMLEYALKHKHHIDVSIIPPEIKWRQKQASGRSSSRSDA
jgi:UDP-sulfoquinovose synthase